MIVNCKSTNISYIDKDDVSRRYLADIRKYDLLEPEEERQLLKDAQQTQDIVKRANAINRLVCCNQRFVISCANKVARPANFLDLVNEGNIGLIEAIQRFDTNQNIRFVTYAVFWIRKQINNYIFDKDVMVHPNNYPKIKQYSSAIQRDFVAQHQRNATPEELRDLILEKYGFNVPDIRDLQCSPHASIDEGVSDDEDMTFQTSNVFNSVTATNNIDEENNREHERLVIESIINTLPKREQFIIKSFFGVCGFEERSMGSIAFELGLSEERVRQIIEKSVKQMKSTHTSNGDFLLM